VGGDASDIVTALLGPEFLFVPDFQPSSPDEINLALGQGPSLIPASEPHAFRKWMQQASRARPALDDWRRLELYLGALNDVLPAFDLAQLPYRAGARWVALPFAGDPPDSGIVSLAMHRIASPAGGGTWAGLLLDEWSELIPRKEETTGIAAHHGDPGAAAPQSILVAVPPGQAEVWDLESLASTIYETADLTRIRAAELDMLGALSPLLPAIYVQLNTANDAVSTNLLGYRVHDATIIARSTR
jgi:hypothetical protein